MLTDIFGHFTVLNIWKFQILFDEKNVLRKYNSAVDIFQEFFEVRRQKYMERREYELKAMDAKLKFTENQVKLNSFKVSKLFDENVQVEMLTLTKISIEQYFFF